MDYCQTLASHRRVSIVARDQVNRRVQSIESKVTSGLLEHNIKEVRSVVTDVLLLFLVEGTLLPGFEDASDSVALSFN